MDETNRISWGGIIAGIILPWVVLNAFGAAAYYGDIPVPNWLNVALTLVILAIIYLLSRPGHAMFAKGLVIGYIVFIVFFIVALFFPEL